MAGPYAGELDARDGCVDEQTPGPGAAIVKDEGPLGAEM